MKKSIEYVQDNNNGEWRINYNEGFAEPIPAYFNDTVSENEIIKYNGKIGDYLVERGAKDIVYKSMPDKWYFKPVNYL